MGDLVVFDIGSTLIHPSFPTMADWLRRRTGFDRRVVDVERAFRLAVNGDLRVPVEDARENQGPIFFGVLGLFEELGIEQIRQLWGEVRDGGGHGSWLYTCVDSEASSLLQRLRQDGHRLVAASNSDGTLHEELCSFGLLHLFDEVYDSTHIGAEKPQPTFYRKVLEQGHNGKTFHVGDDLVNDCIAAAACGFDRVLLYDPLGLSCGLPHYLKVERLSQIPAAMGPI